MPELIAGRLYVTRGGRVVTAHAVVNDERHGDQPDYIRVLRSELGIEDPEGRIWWYYNKHSKGGTWSANDLDINLVELLPETPVIPDRINIADFPQIDWQAKVNHTVIDSEGYYVTRKGDVVLVESALYKDEFPYANDIFCWATKAFKNDGGWYYTDRGHSYSIIIDRRDVICKYTDLISTTDKSHLYPLPDHHIFGLFDMKLYLALKHHPDAKVDTTVSYMYDDRVSVMLWAYYPDTKEYRCFVRPKEYWGNRECELDRGRELRFWRASHDYHNPLTNWHKWIDKFVDKQISYGEFKEVPIRIPVKRGLGVHVSTLDPELIAYYPTMRHVKTLKAQQIKPGRYMKRYFPELGDDEIRKRSASMSGGELRFFKDWRDMYEVYRELDQADIVSSCMSKDRYRWGDAHPLMVYDNSDVELTALYIEGKLVARALYNKHNKQFPMIYGQWEKMKVALEKNGFQHGSLCGAKINRLARDPDSEDKALETYLGDGDLLCPYIDHKRDLDRSSNCSTRVNVMPDHLVIDYYGDYAANDYDNVRIRLDDRDDEDTFVCECCGDRYSTNEEIYIEYDEVSVCEGCWDSDVTTFIRANSRGGVYESRCLERTADNNFVYINDRYYEDSDALRNSGYVYSDFHGEWIHSDEAVWSETEDDWFRDDDIDFHIVAVDDGEDYHRIKDVLLSLEDYWFYDGQIHTDDVEGEGVRLDTLKQAKNEDGSYMYEDGPRGLPSKIWNAIPENPDNNDNDNQQAA